MSNDPAIIEEMLRDSKNIAVVGMSDKATRASHHIGKYLAEHGYHVFPVNPVLKEILGKPCYPDLDSAQAAAKEQTGSGLDIDRQISRRARLSCFPGQSRAQRDSRQAMLSGSRQRASRRERADRLRPRH